MGCGFSVKRSPTTAKREESGNTLEGGRCFYVDGVIFRSYLLRKIEKGNSSCILVFLYFTCSGRAAGARRLPN